MTNTLGYSPDGRIIGSRLIFIGQLVAFSYPFVLLGVFYYTSTIPVLLLPGAALVATASIVIRILQPGPRLAAIGFCVIVSALWLGTIILLRVDPWGVNGWWGD